MSCSAAHCPMTATSSRGYTAPVGLEGDTKISYVRVHVKPGAGSDLFTVTKSQAF